MSNHITGVYDEIAGRAENRMASAVNVPDGPTRMHDAVVRFNVYLLTEDFLNHFLMQRSIVGMNPLEELFPSGQTVSWIKT